MGLLEDIQEAGKDPLQQKFNNWKLHNSSNPTNYESWKESVKEVIHDNREQMKRVLSKIGS
jgi:hypothetical protein